MAAAVATRINSRFSHSSCVAFAKGGAIRYRRTHAVRFGRLMFTKNNRAGSDNPELKQKKNHTETTMNLEPMSVQQNALPIPAPMNRQSEGNA
jgi:hypothetical protein